MLIMAREIFTKPKTGPCGALRDSNLYPIGYFEDFDEFKKSAVKLIETFYLPENDGGNDICGIEHFESEEETEYRGSGKSIYSLQYTHQNKMDRTWCFFDHENFIFCKSCQEILHHWKN